MDYTSFRVEDVEICKGWTPENKEKRIPLYSEALKNANDKEEIVYSKNIRKKQRPLHHSQYIGDFGQMVAE